MKISSTLKFAFLASTFLTTQGAFAEILFSPITNLNQGQSSVGGSFTSSKVKYELNANRDLQRKIFGVDAQHAITDKVILLGQFGYDTKLEYEKVDKSGTGMMFGVGARGTVVTHGQFSLVTYGLFNYTKESISNWDVAGQSVNLDIDITEIEIGGLGKVAVNEMFQVYGGLDATLHSDGDVEAKSNSTSLKVDIKRDDILAIRLGFEVQASREFCARFDAALAGETTFTVGGLLKI